VEVRGSRQICGLAPDRERVERLASRSAILPRQLASYGTPGFFQRFISELAPDGILATVIAGLVALSLVVVESLSYAALIFSGPLSPYIDVGIAITLNTAVVVGLMTAVFGSYPGTIAFSQGKLAALLAFMAAALVSSMVKSVPGDKAALTVAAAISISTVITGAVLAGLGAFRLGHLFVLSPIPSSVDFWPRSAGCSAWVL
jgi:MFS superfamily sulfate permease-like transporter